MPLGRGSTANIEVTVWRRISNPSQIYVSTRPEGGSWDTLNTALDMSMRSSSGLFHQSNAVLVEVPLGRGSTANVEVTVWRRISNPSQIYVSTRPEGGSWDTLNTALDMSTRSSSGLFHQSNAVLVEVPLEDPEPPPAAECVQRDRDALVAFYNSLGGPNWRSRTGWLSERPLGTWRGVGTNPGGCVTSIQLSSNPLERDYPGRGRRSLQPYGSEPAREQRHYRGAPT